MSATINATLFAEYFSVKQINSMKEKDQSYQQKNPFRSLQFSNTIEVKKESDWDIKQKVESNYRDSQINLIQENEQNKRNPNKAQALSSNQYNSDDEQDPE